MEGKEDRRIKLTKRMLKDSLVEMLETVSIHKISIRELCERADINRTTFYKHYGSQYELLEEIETDWLRQVENSTHDIAVPDEAGLLKLLVFAENNYGLSRLLINSNVDPEFPQRVLSLPSVKRLIDAGLLIDEDGYAAEYIQECYVNGGYNIIKHWLNKQDRESPQEMAKIMHYVFRHVKS